MELSEEQKHLVEENIGLVYDIAKSLYIENSWRIKSAGAEEEDLVGLGMLGLCKAAQRYDKEMGNKFSTYAYHKIKGEIIRFFRDHGSLMKMPRFDSIAYENDKQEINSIYSMKTVLSTNKCITGDENDLLIEGILSDEMDYEDVTFNIAADETIEQLEDRKAKAIKLYIKGFSQSEIGKIVGVSQVQVSRYISQSKEKLKELVS